MVSLLDSELDDVSAGSISGWGIMAGCWIVKLMGRCESVFEGAVERSVDFHSTVCNPVFHEFVLRVVIPTGMAGLKITLCKVWPYGLNYYEVWLK